MADQNPAPRTAWAVVVTGVQTQIGLPVWLSDNRGNYFPVPLFIHEDEARVRRRAKSLETRIRSVKFYDGPGMQTSKPILGVVKINLPPKKEGRKPSPEQIANMQAARAKKGGESSKPRESTAKK